MINCEQRNYRCNGYHKNIVNEIKISEDSRIEIIDYTQPSNNGEEEFFTAITFYKKELDNHSVYAPHIYDRAYSAISNISCLKNGSPPEKQNHLPSPSQAFKSSSAFFQSAVVISFILILYYRGDLIGFLLINLLLYLRLEFWYYLTSFYIKLP